MLKCGPWSQGPVFLQQLALLRGFDIGAMDPLGAEFVHTVVECAKLAYADREAYYGDPNFVSVPLGALLSDDYNAERRKLVGRDASLELRPGHRAWPHADRGSRRRRARASADARAGVGEPTVARLGVIGADTCHLDVIDRDGNMVSATPSGGWLQSSPVIPELGFCMGTRGQMFWLKPDLPNSLEPGKRPRTTLSPSFALRDGKPWMAFGTPGGEQQDQWSLIFFLRMVHHNMGIQEAIDAPSFHTEHWPSSFWPRVARPGKVVLEGRFHDAVLDELKARDHEAEKGDDWSEGRLSGARDRGQADARRRQSARHAGLRGRALMRRLVQPGPVHPERIESYEGHSRRLEFPLTTGLSLNDALTRPLVDAGMRSAALVFQGGALGPFSYVMPGPPTDDTHVAYFSAPRSPPGETVVEIANATFGWRDGAPFVHCHGAWIEEGTHRRGGHMLPHETFVAARNHRACMGTARCRDPRRSRSGDQFYPVPSDTVLPPKRMAAGP